MRRRLNVKPIPAKSSAQSIDATSGALSLSREMAQPSVALLSLIVLQVVALAFVAFCTSTARAAPRVDSVSVPTVDGVDTRLAKAKKKKASFRTVQKNHARVKAARKNAQKNVEAMFAAAELAYPPGQVLVRVIKDEDVVELWGANSKKSPMVLVKAFAVCARSGTLGPKRQQGDLQVPEGFYELSKFNPWSAYHLSLGVSYPNRSDRRKGRRPLGGDILIHGDCVTIGCIPIENGPIEELYVAMLDARLNGQRAIPLHIFPSRLDDEGLASLIEGVDAGDDRVAFWRNLQPGFAAFEETKMVPRVKVDKRGDYVVTPASVAPFKR